MTLDEAIKNLRLGLPSNTWILDPVLRESIKLGIEALKVVRGWRKLHPSTGQPLLQGETEE